MKINCKFIAKKKKISEIKKCTRWNPSSILIRLQFLFFFKLYYCSETTESRSTSPQIYSAPVSTQSQSNPLTSLPTSAVPLGQLQSQVSSTAFSTFQPQITSFLHQFEQFANNKNVCIFNRYNFIWMWENIEINFF